MGSHDQLQIGVVASGGVVPGKPVVAELRLMFDGGYKSVTRNLPDFRSAPNAGNSELMFDFGAPFADGEASIHGRGTVLVYLAEPNMDTLATGLVRVERTLSNLLSLPLIVEPGGALRRVAAPTVPQPSSHVAPSASDWGTEYHGLGGLTVTVRNSSSVPVVVRVRDRQEKTVAAQVSVAPVADAVVRLGGGQFDVLMKAQIGGVYRYFKGQPISVPPGTIGQAILSVGIAGGGQGLTEIEAKEFEAGGEAK
jgi:hypothetical protein